MGHRGRGRRTRETDDEVLLDGLVPRADLGSVTRRIVPFDLAVGAVAGSSFLLLAPLERAPERPPAGPNGLEWTVPIGVLVALFALFAGVQGAAAAGRIDLRGTTYVEYARSGFRQLLTVTVLTMGVIVGALRLAPARTSTEQRCQPGLLGALAVLTPVIVATAVSRMWLYQQAHGFTVLRLLVLTCELWLGVGFVLMLHAVVRLRTRAPAFLRTHPDGDVGHPGRGLAELEGVPRYRHAGSSGGVRGRRMRAAPAMAGWLR